MRSPRHAFAAVLLAVLVGATATLAEEQRIALVIGNSAYPTNPLANPVNDAKLISAVLRAQGFEVIEKLDVGQTAMKLAVIEFGSKLEAARGEAVALFYYAGHGIQVSGRNYLIPIDARIENESHVGVFAVSADEVLDVMAFGRNRLNIVILDACRNNPYARSFRAANRGLAMMRAPTGTLIAYSTAPGQVAIDGDGVNSPYTAALARFIREPGVAVEKMFKNVRDDVLAATQGRQTPWEASSLTGEDYYLAAAPELVPELGDDLPEPASVPNTDRSALDLAFWEAIKDSPNATDFEAYLEQFPNGTFAALARNRLEALSETEVAVVTPPPARAAEIPAIALAPPILWDGTWKGRAPAHAPRAVCNHVFSPDMKISLDVESGQITGQARGRGRFKFEVDVIGELIADDSWNAKARGYAYGSAAPWKLILSFSGDFATGKGIWQEAINGCRGELTISRDQ